MTERKTLEQLADEMEAASNRYHGSAIHHVASGSDYRIVGVHFRESDMAICVEYTPIRSMMHNRVKFARSVEEMNFGTRFVFMGGPILANCELDANGRVTRRGHSKRGFDPK